LSQSGLTVPAYAGSLARTLGITSVAVQPAEISKLLERLDGSGSDSEWQAIAQLRSIENLPDYLADYYERSKHFGARAACVFHCVAYARTSDSAFLLGIKATEDKSVVVRYRAALLLTVAQRDQATPALQAMLNRHAGGASARDAAAALQAITMKNPNLFVDRENSGMVTLTVPTQ
jgi:hypothetical protein